MKVDCKHSRNLSLAKGCTFFKLLFARLLMLSVYLFSYLPLICLFLAFPSNKIFVRKLSLSMWFICINCLFFVPFISSLFIPSFPGPLWLIVFVSMKHDWVLCISRVRSSESQFNSPSAHSLPGFRKWTQSFCISPLLRNPANPSFSGYFLFY